MDKRLHKDGVFMATSHRCFSGGIHYFDVADGYGATLIFHGNKAFQNKDYYYLEVPQNGDPLAKDFDELQVQWAKLIDDFLTRHPEYVEKDIYAVPNAELSGREEKL